MQGIFFQRPEVLAGRKVSIGQLPAVRLLASADDPDISPADLETIIACDPALTARLLRLANSPAAGTRRPVASLREALVLLGRLMIKNLAMIAMIHGVEDKTSELATTAIVRAKMCERLAGSVVPESAPSAFFVGLLSVLDAVFDSPAAELVSQLALSDDITTALLDRAGSLGALLDVAVAYERASPTRLDPHRLSPTTALEAYAAAVTWADNAMRSLASPGSPSIDVSAPGPRSKAQARQDRLDAQVREEEQVFRWEHRQDGLYDGLVIAGGRLAEAQGRRTTPTGRCREHGVTDRARCRRGAGRCR